MTATLLAIAILLSGPPPLPFSAYGTIQTGSGAPYTATVGLPVYGICRAERVVTSTVFLSEGAAWYSLDVPGADETRAGCAPGDQVTFQVSRTPAAESAVWASGASGRLDLTLRPNAATIGALSAQPADWLSAIWRNLTRGRPR